MRRTIIAAFTLLVLLGKVLAGDGSRLTLPDVCIQPGEWTVALPVVLSGADELRPSSLRTTVLFDPQAVLVENIQDATRREMSWTLDEEAGTLDLVWHTEGRQPVPPLPAGTLAQIKLRVVDANTREPRLDVDAGQTRSLDGNGRAASVEVAGPAALVQGSGGLWLEVSQERERTIIASSGPSLRGTPWILRGRMGELVRSDQQVLLGGLEAMESGRDGRLSADSALPARGDVFYYLAVRDDGAGQPVLGFDSECRPRTVRVARAETP